MIFHRDAKWRSSFRSETSGNIAVCNYCTCSSQISKSRITLSCHHLPPPENRASIWESLVEEVRNLVANLSNGPPLPKAVRVHAHRDQLAVVLIGCAFLLSSNLCKSFACGQRLLHEKWEPHEIVTGSTFLCAGEVSHCVKCMSRHLLHLKRGCVPLIPWRGRLSIFWSFLSCGTISKAFQTRRFRNGCDAKLIYRHQLVSNCNWQRFLSMTTFACLCYFTKMYKNGELWKLESYLTR